MSRLDKDLEEDLREANVDNWRHCAKCKTMRHHIEIVRLGIKEEVCSLCNYLEQEPPASSMVWWCARCKKRQQFRPTKESLYIYECTTCTWVPNRPTRPSIFKLARRPRNV